jgi:hypothetical protein
MSPILLLKNMGLSKKLFEFEKYGQAQVGWKFTLVTYGQPSINTGACANDIEQKSNIHSTIAQNALIEVSFPKKTLEKTSKYYHGGPNFQI